MGQVSRCGRPVCMQQGEAGNPPCGPSWAGSSSSMQSSSMPSALTTPKHNRTPLRPRPTQSPSQTYLDIPAPPSRREPLWCEQEHPGPIELRRQIFCNRSLNMKQIKARPWSLAVGLEGWRGGGVGSS